MQKRKRIFYLFLSAAIFAVLPLYPAVLPAEDTADLSLKNIIDGTVFNMADCKGKNVIMLFGSIYCKPCIELLPVFNKLYENNKSSKVLILGIDIDKTTEEKEIKKFATEKKIRFPFYIDTINCAGRHKVFMLPTVLLIDPDGKEAKRFMGFKPYNVLEDALEKLVAKSLQEQQ